MQLPRWLLRKRIKPILLTSIFTLAFTLSVIVGVSLPTYTQTSTYTPREKLIKDIKEDAKRDLQNNGSMQIMVVIRTYDNNSVGLTVPEIVDIYEKEFIRLKKENVFVQLPYGWVTSAILLILLIFSNVLKEWLSNLFKKLGNWLYNKLAGIPLLRRTALRRYQQSLVASYKELKISYRPNLPLDMREVYVPLKVAEASDKEQIEAKRAISEYPRLMIKGIPGSGKSMLLKHIVLTYGEEGCLINLPERPIPVWVELHELTDSALNLEKLQQHLVKVLNRHNFPKAERLISQSLEQGKLLLLFDGLDEVNSDIRQNVVKEIKHLLRKYSKCRAFVTCRTAVYKNEFNDVVNQTLEVVEFSDREISIFLKSWESQMPQEKSIDQLLQILREKQRIMSLARNPLLLTIIAYLYCDTPFVLPDSRAEFYQESTNVLLKQRDEERVIDNNKYKPNQKGRVLQKLALYNQDNAQSQQQDRRSIDYEIVLAQIREILPSLSLNPDQDTGAILQEIVERSGLLRQIDSGEKYQFAHLSIQEFFAAKALKDNWRGLVDRFREDPDAWRETIKLWCGLVGDSTELIRAVYKNDDLLAFECLADATEVEQELAQSIIDEFKNQLGTSNNKDNLAKVFGAVAASFRARGLEVFDFLKAVLTKETESASRRSAAARALSMTILPEAAKVLANQYDLKDHEIRESLVKMGDIAVPELVSKADQGDKEALKDLLTIATPDAATALVPFLWWQNDQELASLAAWNLATLIPQFDIEESLDNFPLTEEQRKADHLDWVWQPFTKITNSALPIIIGRIAYLLREYPPRDIPTNEQTLDPRLVIPLCAIELVNQINKSKKFKNLWSPEADNLLAQKEQTPELDREIRNLIGQILTNRTYHHWRSLFSRLPLQLQLDLLRRLINYRQPTSNDWVNLFHEVEYEFKNSWHYQLVLVLALAISLVAVVGIIQIIVPQPETWSNGLLGLAILVVLVFWSFLNRGIEETLEPTTFISFGLFGVFTFWSELFPLYRKKIPWAGAGALN